jgi:hypothetical protein
MKINIKLTINSDVETANIKGKTFQFIATCKDFGVLQERVTR